jgi:hypothetical protein
MEVPVMERGRLSWRPLSFEHVIFAFVLVGQNLLVEFQLLNATKRKARREGRADRQYLISKPMGAI